MSTNNISSKNKIFMLTSNLPKMSPEDINKFMHELSCICFQKERKMNV